MAKLVGHTNSVTELQVGMGQIAAARAPARMKAVLGSCIGLVLYHTRLKTGVMAHIVLPDSAGRAAGSPGKFVDTAIPEMLRMLREIGTPSHGLTAKYTGGANMFGSGGPLQIGEANVTAVLNSLRNSGAQIAGHEVGGSKGRRVVFDCESGLMTIESAGQPARQL